MNGIIGFTLVWCCIWSVFLIVTLIDKYKNKNGNV